MGLAHRSARVSAHRPCARRALARACVRRLFRGANGSVACTDRRAGGRHYPTSRRLGHSHPAPALFVVTAAGRTDWSATFRSATNKTCRAWTAATCPSSRARAVAARDGARGPRRPRADDAVNGLDRRRRCDAQLRRFREDGHLGGQSPSGPWLSARLGVRDRAAWGLVPPWQGARGVPR